MPTSGEIWYVDASALIKTVVAEAESEALREWLAVRPTLVSCDLTRVEAVRAVRLANPEAVPAARRAIATLTMIRLDESLLRAAADLEPPLLRPFDAVHLAAALWLGTDLAGILTYDRRMTEGAHAAGLTVAAPATHQNETS